MTLDDIRAVHANAAATLDELTTAAAAARALVESSETAVANLTTARRDILLKGSDKDLARLDDGIATAGRTAERAAATATALNARVADARAALEEQGRRDRYEAARIAVTDIAVTMPDKYRRLVALAHEILSELGEARSLRMAANHALPEGAAELPDPEGFRHRSSRSTIISKEPLTLWCRTNGTPLTLELQGKVQVRQDGTGKMGAWATGSTNDETYHRKACWRVTIQPETPAPVLRAFDVALSIPPLFTGEAPGWRQDDHYPMPIPMQLAALHDHEPLHPPATIEEIVTADSLDDLKARHRIA